MRSGGIELHRALGYKLTYIGWHSSSALVAAPEKVLFLIIFGCEIWRFRQGLKMIDNSTYIVGIYRPAVIGRLYTFHGVGMLFYPWNR